MKTDHGMDLPRPVQVDFSQIVQQKTDAEGGEVDSATMWELFEGEFLRADGPLATPSVNGNDVRVTVNGKEEQLTGTGNGPLAIYTNALEKVGIDVEIQEYTQHARTAGDDAEAAAYIHADINGRRFWGVGVDSSITVASVKAVTSAINRAYRA